MIFCSVFLPFFSPHIFPEKRVRRLMNGIRARADIGLSCRFGRTAIRTPWNLHAFACRKTRESDLLRLCGD